MSGREGSPPLQIPSLSPNFAIVVAPLSPACCWRRPTECKYSGRFPHANKSAWHDVTNVWRAEKHVDRDGTKRRNRRGDRHLIRQGRRGMQRKAAKIQYHMSNTTRWTRRKSHVCVEETRRLSCCRQTATSDAIKHEVASADSGRCCQNQFDPVKILNNCDERTGRN